MDPNLATTLELAKKYLEPIDNPTTSQTPDDLIVLQRQFIQYSTYAYFFYLQRDIPLARNYQVKAKYLLAQVENLELTIVDKSKVLDKREYLRIMNF